jgi:hypothetical protein
MRPDLDPSQMTPDERRREVAAILAAGLRRLRDRSALTSEPASENPSDAAETPLEAVPENPLSVHVG